jgi:hypothetical protein
VFRLALEDRALVGGRESPIAARDLRLELAARPARVPNEDPQTFHRLAAAEQLAQQFPVGADVDAVEDFGRAFGRLVRTKEERHRLDVDGTAEVHLVIQRRQVLEFGKKTRDGNPGGPVDDDAGRGGTDVVHHQDDRVFEVGVRQLGTGDQQHRGQRLRVVGECRTGNAAQDEQCAERPDHGQNRTCLLASRQPRAKSRALGS